MNYWTRVIPPAVLYPTSTAFDTMVLDTAISILKLPKLSSAAQLQLKLPIRHGGFGLRSMDLTSPAAWWSALAQAYRFILRLVPSPAALTPDVPFVKTQSLCHAFFTKYKIPLKGNPVPPTPAEFWTIYQRQRAYAGTQRLIMVSLYKSLHNQLKSQFKSPSPDFARIVSVSEKSTGLWLTTLPIHPSLIMHNTHFSIASRIRLGLVPFDDLKSCSCNASLLNSPLHFLDCRLFRPLVTARHDRLVHTLARIARSVGVAVVVEPRVSLTDKSRTDANFFFSVCATHIDGTVVHPSCQSMFKVASKPLGAALQREKEKDKLYLARTQALGSRFYPVVIESFGAIGPRARDFIRLLSHEASMNSVHKLYGLTVTNYILRSLAVVLQVSNGVICADASIKARANNHQ
jgi:hypothetical protein